jgi:hypothetical protein
MTDPQLEAAVRAEAKKRNVNPDEVWWMVDHPEAVMAAILADPAVADAVHDALQEVGARERLAKHEKRHPQWASNCKYCDARRYFDREQRR